MSPKPVRNLPSKINAVKLLPYHEAYACSYGHCQKNDDYSDPRLHVCGDSARISGVEELWVTAPTEVGFWRQLDLDRCLIDSVVEELVKQVIIVVSG